MYTIHKRRNGSIPVAGTPQESNNSSDSKGKKIFITCKTSDYIDWHFIKPLQGNLKKRTDKDIEKLCNVIIKRGIRFPSFIAKIKKNIWGIDTHGRLLAYEALEKKGYIIPPIPVVYVEAKDKTEAKKLILECDSRYGTVTQEGFEEFALDINLSAFTDEIEMTQFYQDIEIPEIDFSFLSELDYKNSNTEITFDGDELYKITLIYPAEQYEAVKFALEKRDESPEKIFSEALGV